MAVVGPDLGGHWSATAADSVAVAVPAQTGNDGMAKVDKVIEKLKLERLALHGRLVAKETAHARGCLTAYVYSWTKIKWLRKKRRVRG